MMRVGVYLLWIGLFGGTAAASADSLDPGPRFGPEFTFQLSTNLDPNRSYQEFLAHLRAHLVHHQPLNEVFTYNITPHAAAFASPHGWWFNVDRDGARAVEVHTTPMTVAEFESVAVNIEDAIFTSARNRGMWPALYAGGGHINIDLKYFFDKPILLRNFLVDLVNHSELAFGIMNYDSNNAVPIPLLNDLLDGFQKSIREFDEKLKSTGRSGPNQTMSLMKNLHFRLSGVPHPFRKQWERSRDADIGKFTAVSFTNGYSGDPRELRIEIRSVRAQWNMNQWIRQIMLFRDRMRYLQTNYADKLLPIAIQVPVDQGAMAGDHLRPPVNPEEALRAFYNYVREAGHRWQNHRDYLWPAWVWPNEGETTSVLDRFEQSSWFHEREGLGRTSCVSLLKSVELAERR
jgi:hypothetical protein